jgi:hypothetical protein
MSRGNTDNRELDADTEENADEAPGVPRVPPLPVPEVRERVPSTVPEAAGSREELDAP